MSWGEEYGEHQGGAPYGAHEGGPPFAHLVRRPRARFPWDTSMVTAATVAAAGAVMKTLFDAYTVLVAQSDDTPVALSIPAHSFPMRSDGDIVAYTVSESRFMGRPSAGSFGQLTGTQARTIIAASSAYWNANWIKGKTINDGGIAAGKVLYYDGAQLVYGDHGSIGGLGDDDHTQYHNDARGDARYYTQSQVDALIAALNKLDRGLYRKTPTISDNYRIFYTSRDITITRVRGVTDTGTVTFQIVWRPWTSPFTGGTNVLSSSLVADSDGAETTSFADATIPGASGGAVVCYVSSATSGTPAELEVYVEATVD